MGAVATENLAVAPRKIRMPYFGASSERATKIEGFSRLAQTLPEKCVRCEHMEMHDYRDPVDLDIHCALTCKGAGQRGHRCRKELDAEAWDARFKLKDHFATPGDLFTQEYLLTPSAPLVRNDFPLKRNDFPNGFPEIVKPAAAPTSRDVPRTETTDAW
ncbi:hypothetical protein [Paraburkholderia sp.]|uniref:hypothetical protein n=1 Tax=Paraburkholderia sp. TaxID=1926495 RepID=UPI0039E66426